MWVPKLIGRRGLTTRAISAHRHRPVGHPGQGRRACRSTSCSAASATACRPTSPAATTRRARGCSELQQEMERQRRAGRAGGQDEGRRRCRSARTSSGSRRCARRSGRTSSCWSTRTAPTAPTRRSSSPSGSRSTTSSGSRSRSRRTTTRATASWPRRRRIPIATGENEYTRYGFRDLIAHNAAAILNADAKVLGGVTEFMKVAALAQAHDLDIAPHGSQDIHVHLVVGDRERPDPGVLPRHASTRCGARSTRHAAPERRRHGQPARTCPASAPSRTTTRWRRTASGNMR